MDAQLQTALWMVAVLAPFALNSFFGRRPDAVGLSGMLVIGWGLQRVCWALWTPPEALQFYPVMDAAFGLTTFYAWLTVRRRWKLALTALFIFQCALHSAFWMGWPATSSLLRYIELNNIAFALELCIVASPGVIDVARHFVFRLPVRPQLRGHAGP